MPANLPRFLLIAAVAAILLAVPGCAGLQETRRDLALDCRDESGLAFVCGTGAVEELVALPGGAWLIGGRLNFGGPSGFVAIDRAAGSAQEVAVSFASAAAGCSGPPDPARWSFDGLALVGTRLFAANHGGREAIEVFDVITGLGAPSLRWTGCLPMPAGTLGNALAGDGAGGIYVTSFHDPADIDAWGRMARGEPTGSLWHWPGQGGLERLDFGPLSGANGVAVSRDGAVFVSAWAEAKIVRFDPATGMRQNIATDFLPDNLHFDADGRLLVGGQRALVSDIGGCGAQCPQAWLVARLDLASGAWEELAAGPGSAAVNYACGAQQVGGDIWMTLRGDGRVARISPAR